MYTKKYLIILLNILFFLSEIKICSSSKVLLVMPIGTKSHHIFYKGIVAALASRGHKITVIGPYKFSEHLDNVREIQLSKNHFAIFGINVFNLSMMALFQNWIYKMPKICVDTMTDENVPETLSEDFDLVLMPYALASCYNAYVYQKKIPFIFIYPNTIHSTFSEVMGDLEFPSMSPNIMLPFSYPMNFLQRSLSVYMSACDRFITEFVTRRLAQNLCKEKKIYGYSDNHPTFFNIEKEASLAIINSVRALENPPRPHSSNIIFAGGIHIKPKGQISEDLNKWLDESGDDGFILFSLGSVANSTDMKEEHLNILLKVFKSLKQKVLWKWDSDEMKNLPSNVKIRKWIPQQDILNHPKISLFITHGGLLSTLEATYFEVPVIGMPIIVDQHRNVAQASAEGWARKMDWGELTEGRLRAVILEVTRNSNLRQILAYRSKVMKDLPRSPSEEVIYWVEYVIRHKGAKHLRTPLADMPWYQLYNTDVWLFLLTLAIGVPLVSIYMLCLCCKSLRKNKLKNE